MAAEMLKKLESAAHVLLSAPNVVTSEQRHTAEAIFINFRRMSSPYDLCKHILETSKVDYVLFEAAGLIKEALKNEWPLMASTDICALQNYLLRYIIERPSLAPFVREKMLQLIAVMIKRGSVEDQGEDREKLLQEVQQLISNGNLPQQLVGCGILAALIQEYETSSKSSDIGLPWDKHVFAKNQFERSSLINIFTFVSRALRELIKSEAPPQQLVKQLVSIAASIFSWNFRTFFSRELNNPMLSYLSSRPSASWRHVFINRDTVQTYCEVYWKVRSDPSLAHHAMTCLTQLASFQGHIWDEVDKNDRTAYFSDLVSFLSSFSLFEDGVLDREAFGVAVILNSLASNIDNLTPDGITTFVDHLTNYTCRFAEGAAEEESMCVENTYYMEAFTRLLTTWLKFFSHVPTLEIPFKDFSRNVCTAAVKVIETYIQCHLTPPMGVRGLGREVEAEEIDELEEDDRDKFSDQLECVGFLARQAPEHVLPLLARLLEDCTSRILSQLQRMSTHPVQISDHRIMENLSEDIHWLLLIAGHTLTMDATGETPLIPNELMQYSIKQFDAVDTDITLRVITSPDQYINNIQGAEESCDHVIRLVAAVFRLCDLERRAFEAKLENFMSPQVGCSIMWFLQRWSLSYLLPEESHYTHMSVLIMTAFGKDTEVAAWITNFVLNKIESNLKHAVAEPKLVKDTVDLLTVLLKHPGRTPYVVKTQGFIGIMNLQGICTSDAFPQEAKRGYYEALGRAAHAFESNTGECENILRKLLEPILSRFKGVISQENFVRNFHEARNKSTIVNCFDAYIGVARGCAGSGITVSEFAVHLTPVLSELPSLIGVYINYPEMVENIFELLYNTAESIILYLSKENTKILNTASLQTIRTFANYQSNRLNLRSNDVDDTFKDIQLILKLLSSLLSKVFCDFSFDESRENPQTSESVMSGLYVVLPLINLELLKCPPLCIEFYRTLSYLCNVCEFKDKGGDLPQNLLEAILLAIDIGLRSFIQEVQDHCLSCLSSLVRTIPKENSQNHRLYTSLRPFLITVFDLVVLNTYSRESQITIATLFYELISCYEDDFRDSVRSLIDMQSNRAVAERLESAFERLSRFCQHLPRRRSTIISAKLSIAFESFLTEIQGMVIK